MTGPTTDRWITASQGESVESIAYAHGHCVATLWDHSNNATLRSLRGSPHILFPGDRVFVPATRPKRIACVTDASHEFRRREVPSRITVIVDGAAVGRSMANRPFELRTAGNVVTGTTDADGCAAIPVMPDAPDAVLVIDPGETEWRIPLRMRCLDPITEMSGVQARLKNLGLYDGPIDGLFTVETLVAMRAFQQLARIPLTAALDDTTRASLVELHGC